MSRRVLARSLFVLGAVSSCRLVDDSGFDVWCGEELCEWETLQGEIKKAQTWHKSDKGVELVGSPVVLSQPFDGWGGCYEMTVLGLVEASAQLFIELDVDGDGKEDFSAAVPSTEWNPVTFIFSTPAFADVQLRIHKKGDGQAILGSLTVVGSADCGSVPDDEELDILCSAGLADAGCATPDGG